MPKTIFLGDWAFYPTSGELTRADVQHHLPPRLVRLLEVLCSKPGEVWRREALLDAVWGDRVVNEEALSRAISQLRQKLGDDSAAPSYIATVPKVGYRCVAEISINQDEDISLKSDERVAAEAAATIDQPNGVIETTAQLRKRSIKLHESKGQWPRSSQRLAWLAGLLILILLVLWFELTTRQKPSVSNARPPTDLLFNAQRVTAQPGVERFVEISPDGQIMAYVATHEDRYAVHWVNTRDQDQQHIVESEYSQVSPVFSPDGTHIAVAEFREDGCHVMVLELHGEERRDLGSCHYQGPVPLLDWSQDGRFLAVTDTAQNLDAAAIWQVDLSNGERRQLTQPPDSYHSDARPRYSPDQNYLSFSRGTTAYREIYLLAIDAHHDARALTSDHQYSMSHDWMNDGTAIIFDSDRTGERGLWLMRLALNQNQDIQLEALGARGSQYPSVAAENNQLAFQVAEYEANIWRYSIDANNPDLVPTPERLIASTKYDSNPSISPDGQQMVFVSNRSGRGSLWISGIDGKQVKKLYEPSDGRAAWPVWSADGGQIYFVHYLQGGQWLSVLNLASLTVQRLDLPHQGFGLALSDDGQFWTYTALLDGLGTQVWTMPIDFNGPSQAIGPLGAKRGLLYGGELYFNRDSNASIYRWDAVTKTAELIVEQASGVGWQSWFIHQDALYYINTDEEQASVWRYGLIDGFKKKVITTAPTALGPSMTIDPQNGDFIYSNTDRAEADLFVTQFSID